MIKKLWLHLQSPVRWIRYQRKSSKCYYKNYFRTSQACATHRCYKAAYLKVNATLLWYRAWRRPTLINIQLDFFVQNGWDIGLSSTGGIPRTTRLTATSTVGIQKVSFHWNQHPEVSMWWPSSSRLRQCHRTWITWSIGCIWYCGSPHPYQPAPFDVRNSWHSLEMGHLIYFKPNADSEFCQQQLTIVTVMCAWGAAGKCFRSSVVSALHCRRYCHCPATWLSGTFLCWWYTDLFSWQGFISWHQIATAQGVYQRDRSMDVVRRQNSYG